MSATFPTSEPMARRIRTLLLRVFVAILTVFVIAEAAARLAGVVDFPIYLTDSEIGYIPAPNQKGKFLGRNDWKFNALSMGADGFEPLRKPNLLLIGDSLVYGGNPYRQSEKLGPQIEREMNQAWAVWPIGAGSWAATNEMTYLDRHRDLLPEMRALVWVVNSGDFADRSRWDNEYNHPRSRPTLASVYAWNRYVIPKLPPSLFGPSVEAGAPPTNAPFDKYLPTFEAYLQGLKADFPGLSVAIAWYPSLEQTRVVHGEQPDNDPEHFHALQSELEASCQKAGVVFVDLFHDPAWGAGDYRDSVHPSPEGYRLLAHLLVQKALAPLLATAARSP